MNEELLKAITALNAKDVSEILKEGVHVDLDFPGDIHETPLHLAALHANPRIIKLLLKAGADPNKIDEYGNTPLHRASENDEGHKSGKTVLALLKGGADANIKNSSGHTASYLADDNCNYHAHKTINSFLTESDVSVPLEAMIAAINRGRNPDANRKNDLNALEIVLEHRYGVEPKNKNKQNPNSSARGRKCQKL